MSPSGLSKREACDSCYRRKVRCDGDPTPGNVCSECSKMNLQCTRNIVKRPRGPKPRNSLAPLDSESVQSLISTILTAPTTFSVPTSTHVVRRMLIDLALHSQALEKELASLRSMNSLTGDSPATASSSLTPSDEDRPSRSEIDVDEALSDRLQGLSLNHYRGRHFGQSSHLMPLQSALDARDDLNEGQTEKISLDLKRSDFWDLKPWHVAPQYELIPYEYPPNDLLDILVALFWEHYHPLHPVLHRPTFEKSLAAKLHLYDRTFGSTVLAVCALTSRHSDDARVLYDDTASKHSAGWKYFNQIEFIPKSFVEPPSVHALQMCATIGVHRSGFGKGRDPKEVELWKRAFWQLMILDTAWSIGLGRPKLSNMSDLDLELPAMCDDEYWETPNPDDAFKQPENTPSKLTFWVHYIKLMEILGFAQHSIYSARHLDPWGPTTLSGAEWNQKAVLELDSAMNKWVDALPDFLKYNRHRKDTVFAHQSAMLYTVFYWVQIQVHWSFIPRPGQKSILTFPSLAICANAARSCIHLLDGHHQRYKIPFPNLVPIPFVCAIFLSINLWRGLRLKMSLDAIKEMKDIQKCLDILALYEDRFEFAGRYRDILLSVVSVGQLPPIEKPPSLKLTRSLYDGTSMPANFVEDEPTSRANTGSQQTTQSQYNPSAEESFQLLNVNLDSNVLPVTSNDLGGLPVHIGTEMDVPSNFMANVSENIGMPFDQGPGGMVYNGTASLSSRRVQLFIGSDALMLN
ncbi:hypothetical protein GYMLUDRAFT_248605 [Collybiopsis luxurians FD-317 M1]|uniref:Unplaced genomic scaffold GYMLUscaffold_57, whole genome shotgun sequence n=1 Tax=Collybiopsis luxurians FD-317 M1 TaxID=944289 RepID=A0A0D0C003_9AGAR|nr:hypothetical protein GYMLUDRAFT_248605 [Collybiopsis luxurians FD-317 M1]